MRHHEEYVEHVNMGTITIEGRKLHLELGVRAHHHGIDASVKVPPNYPLTKFQQKLHGNNLHQRLVRISISPQQEWQRYAGDAFYRLKKMIPRTTRVLYVSSFYGIAPKHRVHLSTDEAAAFRGIARRAMCQVLRLASVWFPDLHTSFIMLEASGNVDVDNRNIPNSVPSKQLRKALMANATDANWLKEIEEANMKNLHEMTKDRETNKKLEAMYSRAFGLKVVGTSRFSSLMVGSFADAVQRCNA